MLFEKNVAYLIDTENVGSTWVNLLSTNKKMDLHIFVTENARNLNFSLLHEITENKNRNTYKIHDCKTGKNSLDFHLSSFLGYLIGKNANSAYVIVSQDTGYDGVVEYWSEKGFKVSRIDTKPTDKKRVFNARKIKDHIFKEKPVKPLRKETAPVVKEAVKPEIKVETVVKAPETKPAKKNKKGSAKERLLIKKLPEHTKEEVTKVKEILDTTKVTDNNDIYVALVKEFKQDKGLQIYNLLKKDLKNYYAISE